VMSFLSFRPQSSTLSLSWLDQLYVGLL